MKKPGARCESEGVLRNRLRANNCPSKKRDDRVSQAELPIKACKDCYERITTAVQIKGKTQKPLKDLITGEL